MHNDDGSGAGGGGRLSGERTESKRTIRQFDTRVHKNLFFVRESGRMTNSSLARSYGRTKSKAFESVCYARRESLSVAIHSSPRNLGRVGESRLSTRPMSAMRQQGNAVGFSPAEHAAQICLLAMWGDLSDESPVAGINWDCTWNGYYSTCSWVHVRSFDDRRFSLLRRSDFCFVVAHRVRGYYLSLFPQAWQTRALPS